MKKVKTKAARAITEAERARARSQVVRSLPIRIEDCEVPTHTGKGKRVRWWIHLERREVMEERLIRLDVEPEVQGGSRVYRLARYGKVLAQSTKWEWIPGQDHREARAAAKAELGRKPPVRPRLSAAELRVVRGGPERYPE
jgi:hypothetical protein